MHWRFAHLLEVILSSYLYLVVHYWLCIHLITQSVVWLTLITSRARECEGGIVIVRVHLLVCLSVPFYLTKYVKAKAEIRLRTCPKRQVSPHYPP